jgi:hypothetical protein
MPEPMDLRCIEVDGRSVVTLGSRVLFCFELSDVGMRNLAVVTLRSLRFTGRRVAAVMGLSEEYVATLRSRAARLGSAGVLRVSGRPGKLSAAHLATARRWHTEGTSHVEIGRRLGVHNSTVGRALAAHGAEAAAPLTAQPAELPLLALPQPQPQPQPVPVAEPVPEPVPGPGGAGTARVVEGSFVSRYAGAMLLHAFTDLVGAGAVLGSVATAAPGRRFDDVAVLTAVCTVFSLGFASLSTFALTRRLRRRPVRSRAISGGPAELGKDPKTWPRSTLCVA